MSQVLDLAPGRELTQTLADVFYMLSDGGREAVFADDVVALCERYDPRAVRVALFWSVVNQKIAEKPGLPGAYVVGEELLSMARVGGGFDTAA